MKLSALDLYSVGIGPSSSHTVGPMRAAGRFVGGLRRGGSLTECARVRVELYGSLAATGIGHGTDKAVILGLLGDAPETVDPAAADARVRRAVDSGTLSLGEVGSACAMAAAGLTEVCGGTPAHVENAAEIGLEHNLGLTCDPVGGLAQIPCIERNAIASSKAINASRLALNGDGTHRVSLDQAIETMRETGADMKTKYKETSRGGLAVNVTEC